MQLLAQSLSKDRLARGMDSENQLSRVLLGLTILAGLVKGTARAQQARDDIRLSTLSYRPAVTMESDQDLIQLGSHDTTRCYDWDQDGDLDLLIGGGNGRLWLFRNTSGRHRPTFSARESITAGKRQQWGTSYTGLALAQVLSLIHI